MRTVIAVILLVLLLMALIEPRQIGRIAGEITNAYMAARAGHQ